MEWLVSMPLLLFGVWWLGKRVDSVFERQPSDATDTSVPRETKRTGSPGTTRKTIVLTAIAAALAAPVAAACLLNLDRSTGALRLTSAWNLITLCLITLGVLTILIEIARRTWRR